MVQWFMPLVLNVHVNNRQGQPSFSMCKQEKLTTIRYGHDNWPVHQSRQQLALNPHCQSHDPLSLTLKTDHITNAHHYTISMHWCIAQRIPTITHRLGTLLFVQSLCFILSLLWHKCKLTTAKSQ